MPIKEFIETNISNLKGEDGEGSGNSFFKQYKEKLGAVAEANLKKVFKNYIIQKDCFGGLMLDPRVIKSILLYLSQLDTEILSMLLVLGKKLDVNEQATIRRAYHLAFANRVNETAKKKYEDKRMQLYSCMAVIVHISSMWIKGNNEKDIIKEAYDAFSISKELWASNKLGKKSAKTEENKSSKLEESKPEYTEEAKAPKIEKSKSVMEESTPKHKKIDENISNTNPNPQKTARRSLSTNHLDLLPRLSIHANSPTTVDSQTKKTETASSKPIPRKSFFGLKHR